MLPEARPNWAAGTLAHHEGTEIGRGEACAPFRDGSSTKRRSRDRPLRDVSNAVDRKTQLAHVVPSACALLGPYLDGVRRLRVQQGPEGWPEPPLVLPQV